MLKDNQYVMKLKTLVQLTKDLSHQLGYNHQVFCIAEEHVQQLTYVELSDLLTITPEAFIAELRQYREESLVYKREISAIRIQIQRYLSHPLISEELFTTEIYPLLERMNDIKERADLATDYLYLNFDI